MSTPNKSDGDTTLCIQCRHPNDSRRSTCQKCGTPLPKSQSDAGLSAQSRGSEIFQKGQIFDNRYIVQSIIGRGGMGVIYKVHDNTLKETVALKTLLPELVSDPIVVERFFNEARIARSLSHPNIVRVHDIGTAEDTVYISMEYLHGKSLRDILDGLNPGQRVGIKTVLRIFDELCAALQYAHRFTVHRDIKPENVMVVADGKVKLMDFGISKLMDSTNMTQASMVMGTPQYMSPEQLRSTSTVDGRADLYSVGVMLYEMITGSIPAGAPKPVSEITREVPPALDPIIGKCLEANPDDRYQTAADLREALAEVRRLVDGGSDLAKRTAAPAQTKPRSRGRQFTAIALLLVIAAGTVVGVGYSEKHRLKLLDAVVLEQPTRSQSSARPIPTGGFAALVDVVRAASTNANAAQRQIGNEDRAKLAKMWIKNGDELFILAAQQQGTGEPVALRNAHNALDYYLAVILLPDGMMFVAPGSIDIRGLDGRVANLHVPGFFIDRDGVSAARFAEFSRANQWPWPTAAPATESGSAGRPKPMTNVSYYDALAFAAKQSPQRKLPTKTQWLRALEFVQGRDSLQAWDQATDDDEDSQSANYVLVNGMFEWTRSIEDADPPHTPKFRSTLAICGVVFGLDASATPRTDSALFEARLNSVGFRGVFQLPTALAELRKLLDL